MKEYYLKNKLILGVKLLVSILLVANMFAEPVAVTQHSGLTERMLFHFYHANFAHLLINLYAFWVIKDARPVPALAIASAASVCVVQPTIGFSGVVFALLGMWYGKYDYRKGLRLQCGIAALCVFVPNVSALLHIAALLMGYLYGLMNERARRYYQSTYC